MEDNPIISEIRKIREEILAEHNGDLRALVLAAQKRTEEAERAGKRVVAMPPREPRKLVVSSR